MCGGVAIGNVGSVGVCVETFESMGAPMISTGSNPIAGPHEHKCCDCGVVFACGYVGCGDPDDICLGGDWMMCDECAKVFEQTENAKED